MFRMGARVSVASDQRPLGRAFAEFVTVDESGMETARELVPSDPGLVLQVVHFVDIDAGGRVSTVALGDMSLRSPGLHAGPAARRGPGVHLRG